MKMEWIRNVQVGRVARSMGVFAAIAGIAAGAGVIGAQSAGAGRAPSASPPMIAIVDLEMAIDALTERSDKLAELQKEATAMEAQLKVLAEEGDREQTRVKEMPNGEEKKLAMDKLRDMAFNIEFQRQLAKRRLNQHGADILRDLYVKVDQAAEAYAKKNGFDMVLVSDEKAPIPEDDESAARRAMLLKRMLYVSGNLDITKDLITTMNNAYATKK